MKIFTEGRFGEAVGEILRRDRPEAEVWNLTASQERLAEAVAGADFVAVALWRLYDPECERLDGILAAAGVPWSLVHLAEDMMYCGPVMVPGEGPCYRCFRRRYLTHHPAPERELSLLQAYNRDPELGPAGFIPPMAWMAASALLEDAEPTAVPGRLRRIHLATGALLDTRVLAVHNCPRCGRDPGPRGERFVRDLVPAVEEILR